MESPPSASMQEWNKDLPTWFLKIAVVIDVGISPKNHLRTKKKSSSEIRTRSRTLVRLAQGRAFVREQVEGVRFILEVGEVHEFSGDNSKVACAEGREKNPWIKAGHTMRHSTQHCTQHANRTTCPPLVLHAMLQQLKRTCRWNCKQQLYHVAAILRSIS